MPNTSQITLGGVSYNFKDTEARNMIDNLKKYNLFNYSDDFSKSDYSGGGVSFIYNAQNDTYSVSGTTTTYESRMDLYSNANELPKGMEAGGTYEISYVTTDEKVRCAVIALPSSSWIVNTTQKVTSTVFTIPEGSTGLVVRLYVNTDKTVNGICNYPIILNSELLYVGAGRKIKTIKGAIDYINQNCIFNAKVYIDPGTYDLVEEFGTSYLDNVSVTNGKGIGLPLGNNIHMIFSEGAYIKFLYDGDNTDVCEYFSPFNVTGSFILENANIEVTNARYCVHEDIPTSGSVVPSSYIGIYKNCVMKHNGNTKGTYTATVCIGAGTMKNSISIIEGGSYECSDQFPSAISYHNFNTSTYGNYPSKVIIHNVRVNNKIRLGVFSTSHVDVEISDCYIPDGIFNLDGTGTYFTLTEWNNLPKIDESNGHIAYWSYITIDNNSSVYRKQTNEASLIVKVNEGDIIDIKNQGNKSIYYSFVSDEEIKDGTLAHIVGNVKNIHIETISASLTVPASCTYVVFADVYKCISSAILNKTYDILTNTKLDDSGYQWKADGDLFSVEPSDSLIETSFEPSIPKNWDIPFSKRVVALNHDDLAEEDWENVRKVYNKYGFKANFSLIVTPFSDEATMKRKIKAIKEMIKDGHHIGLHAFFSSSFWWINKLWDIRPDITHTFAPSLEILRDNYNTQTFNYIYTQNSTFESIGYVGFGSQDTVGNISRADFLTNSFRYALAYPYDKVTGLDLENRIESLSYLTWLELWYNVLIDDTMGYSTATTDVIQFFINNYEVPEGTPQTSAAYDAYYPDAEHLISGKIVFFDDTNNPNYNNPDYQKVGRFKKGLFKGHASCCNYEVQDVCIKIAKAFCKHYFGFDHLTTYDRHGINYVGLYYIGDDKIGMYEDPDCHCVCGEFGRVYDTKLGIFETPQDILLRNGITCSTHFSPTRSFIEGQLGLYYGMSGNKAPYFWSSSGYGSIYDYLDLIGSEQGFKNESYTMTEVQSYMQGQKDWIKYAYENSGKIISNGTTTVYMHPFLRRMIDTIRSTEGTNIITTLSLDTIKLSASDHVAVELLCQYCIKNGLEIVPLETARKLALGFSPEIRHNYFPNPTFKQKLLCDFGGESTSAYAYIPDGFALNYDPGITKETFGIEVSKVSSTNVLTISNASGGTNSLETKVYGLAPGEYTFRIKGKTTTGTGITVAVYALKNRDPVQFYPNYAQERQIYPVYEKQFSQSEFETGEGTIVIPEKTYDLYDAENYNEAITKGYANNVSCLFIMIMVPNGSTGSVHSPEIILN